MHCKPGDLAIIVKSWADNEGKIVQCIMLSDKHNAISPDGIIQDAVWITDRQLMSYDGTTDCLVADNQLRPLREAPEDEVLDTALELQCN